MKPKVRTWGANTKFGKVMQAAKTLQIRPELAATILAEVPDARLYDPINRSLWVATPGLKEWLETNQAPFSVSDATPTDPVRHQREHKERHTFSSCCQLCLDEQQKR